MLTQEPIRRRKRRSGVGKRQEVIDGRAAVELPQDAAPNESLYGQLILLAIFALAAALRLLK